MTKFSVGAVISLIFGSCIRVKESVSLNNRGFHGGKYTDLFIATRTLTLRGRLKVKLSRTSRRLTALVHYLTRWFWNRILRRLYFKSLPNPLIIRSFNSPTSHASEVIRVINDEWSAVSQPGRFSNVASWCKHNHAKRTAFIEGSVRKNLNR
jgi:hypothetical protein